MAERHLVAALICGQAHDSSWLLGQAHLLLSVIGGLRSRLDMLRTNSDAALIVARLSGNRLIEFAALSNIGTAHLNSGRLAEAERCFRAARPLAEGRAYDAIGSLDNLAQLALIRGDLTACGELLDALKAFESPSLERATWARLGANLTWARYLANLGHREDALAMLDESGSVANKRRDRLMEGQFALANAALMAEKQEWSAATLLLKSARELVGYRSLESVARAEWIAASVVRAQDAPKRAALHESRAIRILETIGCHSARDELLGRGETALTASTSVESSAAFDDGACLEAVAHCVAFATEPQLLGREVLALLDQLPDIGGAKLTSRTGHETTELATVRWIPDAGLEPGHGTEQAIKLGAVGDVGSDSIYRLALASCRNRR